MTSYPHGHLAPVLEEAVAGSKDGVVITGTDGLQCTACQLSVANALAHDGLMHMQVRCSSTSQVTLVIV